MIPYLLGAATCAAVVPGPPAGQPRACRGRVERVGVVRVVGRDRVLEVWLMFACLEHVDELPLLGARPLEDRHHAVLERWRAEAARWTPGHPDRPGPDRPADPPTAFARGDAAAALLQLVDRVDP